MEIPYQDRIVAFIDILGFSALVDRLAKNPKLHQKLFSALKKIKFYKNIAGDSRFAQKNIEVSVFSDSIVISAEPSHIFDVVWACLGLQSQLLTSGVLLRGGISSGLTVHLDDILYGEGMIRAYRMESGAAVYPRIVIASELIDRITPHHRAVFLDEDHDGMWFIDPFANGLLPPNSDALLEDGWDPNEVALENLGKDIRKELGSASTDNHRMKWQWLENKRVSALNYLREHKRPRIFQLCHQAEQNAARNGDKRRP